MGAHGILRNLPSICVFVVGVLFYLSFCDTFSNRKKYLVAVGE